MRARTSHRKILWLGISLGLGVTTAGGCWEEIRYTPSATNSTASRPAVQDQTAGQAVPPMVAGSPNAIAESPPSEPSPPPAVAEGVDSAADQFAEDVAAKLAAEKPSQPPQLAVVPVAAPAESITSTTKAPASAAPSASTEPAAASADDAAHSSRRIAWLLGSKLSLAALTNDRGDTADETAKLFSQSQTLAKMLDTTVADLPPIAAANAPRPNFDRALEYLFAQGQQVGRVLAAKYGNDHAALLELAVKSNILLALYRPHSRSVESLSSAIEQAGGRSGLPVKLWQPLMDAMANNVPAEELKQVVFRMHSDTDRYLSTPH